MRERGTCVTCDTLDDARRIGYLWAAQCHPCELIVHDAYHRVIERDFIDGGDAHFGSRGRRAASTTARRSRRS